MNIISLKMKPVDAITQCEMINLYEAVEAAFQSDNGINRLDINDIHDEDIPNATTPEETICQSLGENFKNFADFKFILGDEKKVIKIAKMIFEIRSPVFYQLMQQYPGDSYAIEWCLPKIFETFVHYMYTDKIQIGLLLDEDLFHLIDLANLFKISELSIFCAERIKQMVDIHNICCLYKCADKHKIESLQSFLLEFIIMNINDLLTTEAFLSFDERIFSKILQSDRLRVSELSLFDAVISWGEKRLQGLESNSKDQRSLTLREIVQDLMTNIRFNLISAAEFAENIRKSKALDAGEVVRIFEYICLPDHLKFQDERFQKGPRGSMAKDCVINSAHPNSESSAIASLPVVTSLNNSFIQNNKIQKDALRSPVKNYNKQSDLNTEQGDSNVIAPETEVSSIINENRNPDINANDTNTTFNAKRRKHNKRRSSPTLSLISNISRRSSIRLAGLAAQKKNRNEVGNTFMPPKSTPGKSPKKVKISEVVMVNEETSSDEDFEVRQILSNHSDISWCSYIRKWEVCKELGSVVEVNLSQHSIKHRYPYINMSSMRNLNLDLIFDLPDSFNRFQRLFDLREFIFFRNKNINWKFQDLWSLDIPICIIVNGVTMFNINKTQRRLIISCPNDSKTIMAGLKPTDKLFELSLCTTGFPPKGFPYKFLKDVLLFKVKTTFATEVAEFLRECPDLLHFSCFVERSGCKTCNVGVTTIDLAKDFASRNQLQRLSLCTVKLLYDREHLKESKISNLSELHLNACYWTETFPEDIHKLFPRLKKASFSQGTPSDRISEDDVDEIYCWVISANLINNCLKIATIQWLRIWNMECDIPLELDNNDLPSPTKCLRSKTDFKTNVTNFQQVMHAAALPVDAKCFLLEKVGCNNSTNEWKGILYDYPTPEVTAESHQQDFEFFHLEKIYKDIAIYNKCNNNEDI